MAHRNPKHSLQLLLVSETKSVDFSLVIDPETAIESQSSRPAERHEHSGISQRALSRAARTSSYGQSGMRLLTSVLNNICRGLWPMNGRREQQSKSSIALELLRAAHAAALCNEKHSRLIQLPNELLLIIAETLPVVSRQMLRQVCASLRWRFGMVPRPATPLESIQMAALIRRSHSEATPLPSNWLWQELHAHLERLGLSDRLYCSCCRVLHRCKRFSHAQQHLGPDRRVCLRLEGHIKLCEHFSFAAQCVINGMRQLRSWRWMCNRCYPWFVRGRREAGDNDYRAMLAVFEDGTVEIDRQVYICPGLPDHHPTIAAATWLPILRGVDCFICPHLSSGEITASDFSGSWNAFSKPMVFRYEQGKRHHRYRGSPGGSRWLAWGRCKHSHCRTRYIVSRYWDYSGKRSVRLDISRDLAGHPADPTWQAQLTYDDSRPSNAADTYKPSESHGTLETDDALAMGCDHGKCKGECCLYRFKKSLLV